MGWIGNPGALQRSTFVESQQVSAERPSTMSVTIGGRRVAQVGPRAHRTWEISLHEKEKSSEVSIWQAFFDGEYGPGPFTFVSDMATTTNVISPRGAVLDLGATQNGVSKNGGPMLLPGGRTAGRSALIDPGVLGFFPWVNGYEYVPVVPGVPVTVSAYVRGKGSRLRARLYTNQQVLTRTSGSVTAANAAAERLSVTVTPAEGEAYVLLLVDSNDGSAPVRVARPAVTYTSAPRPWAAGSGAASVIVSEASISPVRDYGSESLAGASYKVEEVG